MNALWKGIYGRFVIKNNNNFCLIVFVIYCWSCFMELKMSNDFLKVFFIILFVLFVIVVAGSQGYKKDIEKLRQERQNIEIKR